MNTKIMTLSAIKKMTWLLFLAITTKAQDVQLFALAPFPLEITFNKTVNLVFAYPIKSVDKGSADILARKAKGAENILQLKASRKDFCQTNLTVITSDGKLYCFVVDYSDHPTQLTIEVVKEGVAQGSTAAKLTGAVDEQTLAGLCQKAAAQKKRVHRITDASHRARLTLSGLAVQDDLIFYRFKLRNRSSVSYQIESLRFVVQDKKRIKRSSSQEQQVQPVYVYGDTATVDAGATHEFVAALAKFPITDQKELTIVLMEKNGGRHLGLKVPTKTIIRANPMDKS